jgi:hypothetical protein
MHLYGSIRFSSATLLLYLISALTALAQNTPLRGRVLVTPKVDYQIGQNNTASIRYRFTDSDLPTSGLGAFNLVESAYHAHSLAQTTQFRGDCRSGAECTE